jgi:molybdopterin-guanine dinucleotide biosynthesis protein A
MDRVTGIILAGGVSRRLNYRNKALLKIDHRSVIEYIIEAVSEVTAEILLITNSPNDFEHLRLPMFRDILPGSGSLGGIYTGLRVSKTYYNLVLACDIPFIQPCLLKFLIDQMQGYDVALPVTPDGYQPTCAIYSKDCIQAIEMQIHDGNLKIANFFPNVRVNKINFSAPNPCYEPNMFFNINTIEDYSKALAIAKETRL